MKTQSLKKRFHAFDASLKTRYPRAYPWLWFGTLWVFGFLSLTILAYGLRAMIQVGM